MATIKSHQNWCGGISHRKKYLLKQDVSCSVYISVMHTLESWWQETISSTEDTTYYHRHQRQNGKEYNGTEDA